MKEQRPIGFVVRNLSRLIGRRADSSAGRKQLDSLTGTNGWIIGYIAHNSYRDVFQKDIETRFSVRRSTVSRVITLMEQKGLVKREGVDGDGRLKKLVLTDKAWEIHKEIEADLDGIDKELTSGIPEEDLAVFMRVADRMIENMGVCCKCHEKEEE